MIDWTRLKPYEGNRHRSFEEFCYQVAKVLYGHLGRLTSIDDSGGGDGVEFYLTLHDGAQWGWQAKFYYPRGSLGRSNRKRSVQTSLQKACDEHPRLEKWFLCTPRNLTRGDQKWFDEDLAQSMLNDRQVVPIDRCVELENWGESDFNAWMSEPRFAGKSHYFFGELELTLDWFRAKSFKHMESFRSEFNPSLHTVTGVDGPLHALLGDTAYRQSLAEQMADIDRQVGEHSEAVRGLREQLPRQIDLKDAKANLTIAAESLQRALSLVGAQLHRAHELLGEPRLDEVRHLDWASLTDRVGHAYDEYEEVGSSLDLSKLEYSGEDANRQRVIHEVDLIVRRPAWIADDLRHSLGSVIAELEFLGHADLHIVGPAGVGKTHTVFHVCRERLDGGLPALLLLGDQFTSDRPLSEQLRAILDIPPTYSWGQFLQALDAAAEAYHTRIPLVIDALDRSTHNGRFSGIWQGLAGLVHDIAQTKDVALVTTYRSTYSKAIWPSGAPQHTAHARGFSAYDVETAVEKYFAWYKIEADLTAAPLSQFDIPSTSRSSAKAQTLNGGMKGTSTLASRHCSMSSTST